MKNVPLSTESRIIQGRAELRIAVANVASGRVGIPLTEPGSGSADASPARGPTTNSLPVCNASPQSAETSTCLHGVPLSQPASSLRCSSPLCCAGAGECCRGVPGLAAARTHPASDLRTE
jgi:hypothetical protein